MIARINNGSLSFHTNTFFTDPISTKHLSFVKPKIATILADIVQVLGGDIWRHDRDEGQACDYQPVRVHRIHGQD